MRCILSWCSSLINANQKDSRKLSFWKCNNKLMVIDLHSMVNASAKYSQNVSVVVHDLLLTAAIQMMLIVWCDLVLNGIPHFEKVFINSCEHTRFFLGAVCVRKDASMGHLFLSCPHRIISLRLCIRAYYFVCIVAIDCSCADRRYSLVRPRKWLRSIFLWPVWLSIFVHCSHALSADSKWM